jgi:hypothetical protein
VVQIGGVTFKRYSMKALDELQKAFKTVDMDKIWSLNKPTGSLQRPALPLFVTVVASCQVHASPHVKVCST